MTLPVEIWMLILESLNLDTVARPSYVNCFVTAIIRGTATEQDLVAELPAFEKRAWKLTRSYYAIDGKSREAAHRSFISGVLLQTCHPPLAEVPKLREKLAVKGKARLHIQRPCQPFYAWQALKTMKPQPTPSGLQPTYMALELFNYSIYDSARRKIREVVDYQMKCKTLGTLQKHHMAWLRDAPLLRTVRLVELLAAEPNERLKEVAAEKAERMKVFIEEQWRTFGVEDGVVRVFY